MNLIEIRKRINDKLTDYSLAKKQYKEEKASLKQSEILLTNIKEAQIIAQNISQHIQQQAHNKIAGVVSRCLKTIFEDDYDFTIVFEQKRGRTEAKLLLRKGGNDIEDAINEDSGGVVEIAAFALRLSCLLLSKPALRRILILDEPFKNVSLENMEKIKLLVEGLSKDFGVQFIIVTHITTLHIGKVITL